MLALLEEKIVDKLLSCLINRKGVLIDRRTIRKNRSSYKKLSHHKELSDAQKKEVQEFYQHCLGHKVPLEWHRYFYSRTGFYSKYYIPSSEYKNHLIGRLNIYPFHLAYNDKNMTDMTLPNTRQPYIFLKNMNGYFYFEGKPVSREEALSLCADLGDVIVKPSLTGRGKGVRRVHIEDGNTDYAGKSLSDLFDDYKADYLIQDVIHQHPGMAALNPTSINTIRILTYRSGMEILPIYTVVRIGRSGMVVDNESAGGISARINFDGTIAKYAYGAPGVDKVEMTDSGVRLEGYKVPSYDKALAFVKESHIHLPYFNLIGWDIAITENGDPIMIELNLNPDLSQSANGPAFGEYTEMILKDAMNRKSSQTPLTMMIMNKRTY